MPLNKSPLTVQTGAAVSQGLNVVALVSIGMHPTSGRQRRAELDARAVEQGLRLIHTPATPQHPAHTLDVVHCGSTDTPALKQYAGMGLPHLTILEQPTQNDPLPSLIDYLQTTRADIVLAGMRAESGESSGMLPYLLANTLNMPIINSVAEIISVNQGQVECLQALPRGQRRKVMVNLPCVITVDMAAAAPRQSAFGPGQRASFTSVPVKETADTVRLSWTITPAKPRPKRMKTVKAKTAADRFKAATAKPEQQGGRVIAEESPDNMAHMLIDYLLSEKAISTANKQPN